MARDPAIADLPNGDGVESMELFATELPRRNEADGRQDAQVFHDAESGHFHLFPERTRCLAVLGSQEIEEFAASGSPAGHLRRPSVRIKPISTYFIDI
jgi:hypothetical protein